MSNSIALQLAEEMIAKKEAAMVVEPLPIKGEMIDYAQSAAIRKAKIVEKPKSDKPIYAKPWHGVTDEDIVSIISGTALEPIFNAHLAPTRPALPVPVALLKTLVLAGCALCGQKEVKESSIPMFGIHRARLKIMTAGGQATNMYALLVANSSTGKDIGNVTSQIAIRKNYKVASGGSAEGIADALSSRPSGLVTISEFMNYIDKKSWQSGAASFLTAAFNEGTYQMALSKRQQGASERNLPYCYPSIIANVQPGVLEKKATSIDLESGFLGRFIMAQAKPNGARPVARDLEGEIHDACISLERYELKAGVVQVGDAYCQDLYNMFDQGGATFQSHWKRLVNEYAPRFAVMFSVDDKDRSINDVTLKPEHWNKAETLVKYLYSSAEEILQGVNNEEQDKRFEWLCRRVESIISKTPGCNRKHISRYIGKPCRKEEREGAFIELIDRGLISVIDNKFYPGDVNE
jgi:hypothetical protein